MTFSKVVRAVLVSALLSLVSALPAGAQHLVELAEGRLSDFDNRSALFGRAYMQALLTALGEECEKYPIPAVPDASGITRYTLYGMTGRTDIGRISAITGQNATLAGYLENLVPQKKVTYRAQREGCGTAAHAKWVATAARYLNDPMLGGDIQSVVRSACEASHEGFADCACFAMQFDYESKPEQRRRLLQAADKKSALQDLMLPMNAGATMGFRCGRVPNFGAPNIPPEKRGIPTVRTVYEGIFLSRISARASAMACLIKPGAEPNERSISCNLGHDGYATGRLVIDGTRITMVFDEGTPVRMPRDWELTADGGMKPVDDSPGFRLNRPRPQ